MKGTDESRLFAKEKGINFMEEFQMLKKSTKVSLTASVVLCALSLIVQAIAFADVGMSVMGVRHLAYIVMDAFLLSYVLWGYKKPHGNHLRYLFVCFGVFLAYQITLNVSNFNFGDYCILAAALMITYISGRLDKIQKNKALMVVGGLLFVASWLWSLFAVFINAGVSLPRLLGSLNPIAFYAAICSAYIARYEAHSVAGLEDAN